ncbi:hypothetical protein MAP00_004870 [Monascus purpureus]|nr:hypothetical protein MAP00_004870 [Monascus purpureus]
MAPSAPPPPPPVAPPVPPPSEPPSRPSSFATTASTIMSSINHHTSHQPDRQRLDPSAYTLSNGGSSASSTSGSHGVVRIDDNRFKFQGESLLPKPRPFSGGTRRYRAGRGSSVPLNLSALGG